MTKPPITAKRPERPMRPQALSDWRTRMGYSQRDAARALGCARGAWTKWESGTNRIPRYVGLAMAALAMGMTPFGAEPVQGGE